MFESTLGAAAAALLVFVTVVIPRCAAQAPPGYDDSSLPPDSLVTMSGTTYMPTSYTITNPACTGTVAICPCATGYLCLTIADCHWKCLMTSFPPFSYSPTTAPSVSASGTSVTAVTETSVSGAATTLPSSTRLSTPPVTQPLSSVATGGGSTGVPTESLPGSQDGGGSQSSGVQGGTSQGGGGQSSGGQGATTRSSLHQTETAAPGQTNVITVTEYPTTCKRWTGTRTLFTTDYVTSCPATCPS